MYAECFTAWLQANFANGRVEEFLLDQAINAEDMQSGSIAFCVATAMAHFHFSPLILSRNGVAPKAILWDRTRAWARSVQQHYSTAELKALRLHNVLQEVRCLTHLHCADKELYLDTRGSAAIQIFFWASSILRAIGFATGAAQIDSTSTSSLPICAALL